jgi:hypothetical protein
MGAEQDDNAITATAAAALENAGMLTKGVIRNVNRLT